MNRQKYVTEIIRLLTRIPANVNASNKHNLTDVNIYSEDFYCNLLNLIYGYTLENTNKHKQNAAAIDLFDDLNRIAVQVTATSELKKTRETVEKFIEKGFNSKYDRLIILNIDKKSKHKEQFVGGGSFKIDTKKDVWDVNDIIGDIKYIDDIDKLKDIHTLVVKELCDANMKTTRLPNEVGTILSIIEMLSDESHPDVGSGYIEDPDPKGKIYSRFSEHSSYLTERFVELYIEYGRVLETVLDESDIGSVSQRRAGSYLRPYSDRILNECDNNPEKALLKILDSFNEHLSENNFNFDYGAAEFYMIDQLIKCNVFPNKIR
ncbi:SMEK domain-containing protein [Providencia sp. PROV169]|uniref:SMEK domain-containing protein n=1 Tax=Providencia sp. PROV169 TaxID=2949875 RepID=UPI002348F0FB|nr:SMEK domain-containing protein [Providencia sp. PROV169]